MLSNPSSFSLPVQNRLSVGKQHKSEEALLGVGCSNQDLTVTFTLAPAEGAQDRRPTEALGPHILLKTLPLCCFWEIWARAQSWLGQIPQNQPPRSSEPRLADAATRSQTWCHGDRGGGGTETTVDDHMLRTGSRRTRTRILRLKLRTEMRLYRGPGY